MEAGTPTPPISAELWQRLKALDRRCNCFMTREDQWLVRGAVGQLLWGMGGPPDPHRRAWRVHISLRGSVNMFDMLDVAQERLADALLAAVEQAERKGWHLEHPHRGEASEVAVTLTVGGQGP